MTYQLNLQELACQRGEQPLFSGLSWEFGVGSLTQIEGHNGIGKTSLLRIMAGLAQPVAGQVNWNGRDIRRQREEYAANLLYLGHHSGIKPELTPWENLRFYQQVSAARQGDEVLWDVLEKVGLLGREDLPAGQLSAGQQKRIALARLWLSQAPLWILDEPFTAIDKHGVQILTRLFEAHAEQGGIVILTSHQDIPSEKLEKLNLAHFKSRTESQ